MTKISEKLNRRALIGHSAAALSAFAVVPVAVQATAAPSDDPIFALIEVHRRAHVAFEEVLSKKTLAEERLEAEGGSWFPEVQICVLRPDFYFSTGGSSPEDLLMNAQFVEAHRVNGRAETHEQIDALLKSDPIQAQSAHAELDRQIKLKAELIGPHDAAEGEALRLEGEAKRRLFGTAPATLAGLIALMRYSRVTDDQDRDVFQDGDDAFELLLSIENSICALVGVQAPQPPEII
jgi:hypothetical protein